MSKFEEATSDMPSEEYKKLSQLVGDYTKKNKSKMKIKSLKQITIHKMKQTVSNPMIEIKHKVQLMKEQINNTIQTKNRKMIKHQNKNNNLKNSKKIVTMKLRKMRNVRIQTNK